MENKEDEFNFLDFHSKFCPRVTEMEWPDIFQVPLFDFELILSHENGEHIGRGSSRTSKDQAITIACVEAVERATISYHKVSTSNGVAAHLNKSNAKINAMKELIERHAFLSQFYSGKFHGKRIDLCFQTSWKNYPKIEPMNFHIANVDCDSTSFSVVLNVARISSDNGVGVSIGLGCSHNPLDAALAAEIENLRLCSHVLLEKTESIDLELFNNLPIHTFEHHGRLALNSNFCKKIANTLQVDQTQPQQMFLDISCEQLSLPPSLHSSSIYVMKASSSDALNLFTGFPNQEFAAQFLRITGTPIQLNLPPPLA